MALVDLFRADTWMNILSGIGVRGKDRRRATTIEPVIVSDAEAREMWQSDFLARACIEKLPETAYRDGGFTINIKGETGKSLGEDIQGRIEDENLDLVAHLIQGAKFERGYGGAGLFPVVVDGSTDFTQPLRENSIMSCKAVHVFEPRELTVTSWYDDIMQPKYRHPKTYRMQPISGLGRSIELHESRLIIFPGVRISNDRTTAERPGWGDNALTVAKQTLADFGMALGGVATGLDQFSQGVLSLAGLGDMLAVDNGKQVRDRLVLMDQAKSILRSLVIDANDKYERKDISFAGVEGIVNMWMYVVAAALDVPVALLFGMEPAGMNATGAFDIRSYYDRVGNVRGARYRTPTERAIRLTCMLPKDGPCKGKEPPQWSIEWKPLWQMSDKEREDARNVRTENDVALIEAQIATADEIRKARFGGDTYSYELQLTGDAPVPAMDPAHLALLQSMNSNRPGRALPPGSNLRDVAAAALDAPDARPPPANEDTSSPQDTTTAEEEAA